MKPDHDDTATQADLRTASIRQRAKRRVALKTGWLIHALVFALVNGGLFLMSTVGGWSGGPMRWHGGGISLPIWGWALGLAIHGIVVLVRLQGDGMTQRMIDREIETLERRERG